MDTVNLQNALFVIGDIAANSVLNPDGAEIGKAEHPVQRKWRRLRNRLPNLFIHGEYRRAEVARWLNDAGYMTVCGNSNGEFTEERVTPKIEQRVRDWAYIVSWGLATFEPSAVSMVRKRFDQYHNARRRGHIAPSTASLFSDLGAADSDIRVWEEFLVGMVTTDTIPARFALHHAGRPEISIAPESPMHAIVLTIFVDRVLTKRKLTRCKQCGREFVGRTKGQMFCPPTGYGLSHQSLWKTRFRRAKVKAVKKAHETAGKKWDRVASRATAILRKQYPEEPMDKLRISPQWAKQEIVKGAQ